MTLFSCCWQLWCTMFIHGLLSMSRDTIINRHSIYFSCLIGRLKSFYFFLHVQRHDCFVWSFRNQIMTTKITTITITITTASTTTTSRVEVKLWLLLSKQLQLQHQTSTAAALFCDWGFVMKAFTKSFHHNNNIITTTTRCLGRSYVASACKQLIHHNKSTTT